MPKPVCVPCAREMVFEHSGVNVQFNLRTGQPYQVWNGEHAKQIGWGASLVECIILGMKYTGDILEVDEDNFPHYDGNLGGLPIACFAGPMFDQLEAAGGKKPE